MSSRSPWGQQALKRVYLRQLLIVCRTMHNHISWAGVDIHAGEKADVKVPTWHVVCGREAGWIYCQDLWDGRQFRHCCVLIDVLINSAQEVIVFILFFNCQATFFYFAIPEPELCADTLPWGFLSYRRGICRSQQLSVATTSVAWFVVWWQVRGECN